MDPGWKWSEQRYTRQWSALDGAIQSTIQTELRDHAIRLLKGIALILIVAMAIDVLALATLALVGIG